MPLGVQTSEVSPYQKLLDGLSGEADTVSVVPPTTDIGPTSDFGSYGAATADHVHRGVSRVEVEGSAITGSVTMVGTDDRVDISTDGNTVTFAAPGTPVYDSIKLTDLTASRLVSTDASKVLESSDVSSWIAGTVNQVVVTDDGDGTATLSTPQDIHVGATPTFAGMTLNGNLLMSGANQVQFRNSNLYFYSSGTNNLDLVIGGASEYGFSLTALDMKSNGILNVANVYYAFSGEIGLAGNERLEFNNGGTITCFGANFVLDGTNQVQFGDSATFINQSADSILTYSADGHHSFVGLLDLQTTTSSTGQITRNGGTRLLHTYGPGDSNFFAGVLAGNFTMTGANNTAVGRNSGWMLTTGSQDTFYGYQAGLNVTSGNDNVGVGYQACRGAAGGMTGSFNMCVGRLTGIALTSGSSNILIGNTAGFRLTTGGSNVYLGSSTGTFNTTGIANVGIGSGNSIFGSGSQNVVIGDNAYRGALGVTTGNYNAIIGSESGFDVTSAASLVLIGRRSGFNVTSGANSVIIGQQAGHTLTTNGNCIFIGPTAGFYETGAQKVFIDYTTRGGEDDARVKAWLYGEMAATTAAQLFRVNAVAEILETLHMQTDSKGVIFGGDSDMDIGYDGLDGYIRTDLVAASDLKVDCGAEKTIELQTTVWDDINFGAGQAQQPASGTPTTVTFTDNLGADTDIATKGFAVGEKLSWITEYLHDCKEDADFYFHVHFQVDAAPTGTDYVKWQVDFTITSDGATCAPVTISVVEVAVDTQHEQVRANFPVTSGVFTIGDQVKVTLRRIASAGDAYAGDAKVCTFGLHVQKDTMGSRQIGVK